MFKKQGIPPQVAFQTFREGWWFLVRAERLDGKGKNVDIDALSPIISKMDPDDIKKFENVKPEESLLQAWPMLVRNIAQKSGKVKLQFKAPSVPGKYRFIVTIMSQEFLGADDEFSLEAEVVDIESLEREVKKKIEELGVNMPESESGEKATSDE